MLFRVNNLSIDTICGSNLVFSYNKNFGFMIKLMIKKKELIKHARYDKYISCQFGVNYTISRLERLKIQI